MLDSFPTGTNKLELWLLKFITWSGLSWRLWIPWGTRTRTVTSQWQKAWLLHPNFGREPAAPTVFPSFHFLFFSVFLSFGFFFFQFFWLLTSFFLDDLRGGEILLSVSAQWVFCVSSWPRWWSSICYVHHFTSAHDTKSFEVWATPRARLFIRLGVDLSVCSRAPCRVVRTGSQLQILIS